MPKKNASQTEKGNERLKRKLFYSNLELVSNIVKKHKKENSNLTEFDLFCEGMLALLQAIKLFNWKNNYKFSTLAILLIRKAILKSIKERKTAFKGVVSKAPPWPDFSNETIYIDYFDERKNIWVLEKMREWTEKKKEDIHLQLKIDIKKNYSEISGLISEIMDIPKSEVKQELKKFYKNKKYPTF
jgi:RNA polymerase sigma factor (sigma-70 family)